MPFLVRNFWRNSRGFFKKCTSNKNDGEQPLTFVIMSYHPSKDFSDLYLILLEQYRNLAFGRAVQFFSAIIIPSAVYTFFAGFTSFMGFIGTMQHLSWFTFVMRFLHTTQFQIFFLIWLTIIDVCSTLEKWISHFEFLIYTKGLLLQPVFPE